jgi:short-subunit dehydrogenase
VPGEGTRIVEECLTSLGGLDVLICNAGYGIYQPVAETTPEAMSRIWQVNYQSGYESVHAALPRFLEKGRGHIILTSSIIGKKGLAYAGAYCATKFAQVGLGEALWGELKGTGVGLSVICPGYTATEFHGVASGDGQRPVSRPFQGQHPRVAAAAMVRAVKRRKRETILTLPGKALILLNRLSPTLAAHVMALVGRREYAPKGP